MSDVAVFVSDVLKMTDAEWSELERVERVYFREREDFQGSPHVGWIEPSDDEMDTYDTLLVRGYVERRYHLEHREYRILEPGMKIIHWRDNLKEALFKEWLDKQRG